MTKEFWIPAVAAVPTFGIGYLLWKFAGPITRAMNKANSLVFSFWRYRYPEEGTRLIGVGGMAIGVVCVVASLLLLVRG